MKILMISLISLFIVSAVSVEAEPQYAKWGTIAVKETQQRYKADIIDYKHIGRTELTPKKSEEKFKLWLRSKEGNEFGVYVSIQFDRSTEIIQSIRFSKSNRAVEFKENEGSINGFLCHGSKLPRIAYGKLIFTRSLQK